MKRQSSGVVSQITAIPLFHGLAKPAIEMLQGILLERRFLKGENIFLEGTESTGFFIVLKGRVKVYKLSRDGKEQTLHIVGPKELLGAVSAFAGAPYPAFADTIEKTTALFFPRRDFLALIRKEPSVVMNMMANLAKRLQHFTSMIEDLSLKEVPGRLAAYLLYMCRQTECRDAVSIEVTKSQLASLLGTIPETLSRILRKMSDRGIITVTGRRIQLIDKKALQDIIGGVKTGF